MMNTKNSRLALGLLGICLIALGCQTEQAGVSNSIGTIKATLAAKPAAVTEAAGVALKEMDLIIINTTSTSTDGRVVARTTQDVKVSVDSRRVGDGVSDVSIRVGKFGDSGLSLTILDEIKDELGIEPDIIEVDEDEYEEEAEEANEVK